LQEVGPLRLVVVVGEEQAPKKFPLVAIVVGETFHMMIVVVMVRGMICIQSLLTRLLLPE